MPLRALRVCLLAVMLTPAAALEDPPRPELPPAHLQTDEEIKAAVVKGVVVNPSVLAAALRVEVEKSAVTIRGFVRDEEAKTAAEKVAARVPGVRSVKNLLETRAAAPANQAETEAAWFQGSPAEFQKLDVAKEEIDPKNLREPLLSAAIFHETNQRRADLKLPALAFHEKARAAAVAHALAMAKHATLSHGTPWKEPGSSAYKRLVAEGLQPRFSAENIAFSFVLRYESGKPFYTREEKGQPVHSYEPNGAPLALHTYLSFAEAILTQWMNSPGHRKNIVAPEPEFLGVGCALSRDEKGFDKIYADQDFFAPLPTAPAALVP